MRLTRVMLSFLILLAGIVLAAAFSFQTSSQGRTAPGSSLFEGARLITGDGGALIEILHSSSRTIASCGLLFALSPKQPDA